MRAAVPLLGYTVLQAGSDLDSAGEAFILTVMGALAVVVVDAAVLAYDEVPVDKPSVNLALSAGREGASLRVAGTF